MRGLIAALAVAFVLVLSCALADDAKAGGFGFAQQAQCVQQVCAVPQLQVQQVYVPQVQAVVVPKVQQVVVPQIQYQQQAVVIQKQQSVVQKQRFAKQGAVLKQVAPQRQTIRQRIVTRSSRF